MNILDPSFYRILFLIFLLMAPSKLKISPNLLFSPLHWFHVLYSIPGNFRGVLQPWRTHDKKKHGIWPPKNGFVKCMPNLKEVHKFRVFVMRTIYSQCNSSCTCTIPRRFVGEGSHVLCYEIRMSWFVRMACATRGVVDGSAFWWQNVVNDQWAHQLPCSSWKVCGWSWRTDIGFGNLLEHWEEKRPGMNGVLGYEGPCIALS